MKTGIERANIAKYEKGQLNATIETLLKIATAIEADLRVDFVLRPGRADDEARTDDDE